MSMRFSQCLRKFPMKKFKLSIDPGSSVPKYRQIVNQVTDAAGSGIVEAGFQLPSVNQLIHELDLSRDTIFKAYEYLREIGVVDAIQGKGYFIHSSKIRILLFLDKYSPFKEGLYNSMRQNLPENYSIDLYFHHYNLEVFENVLKSGVGRYNFFVIMSFDDPGVAGVLKKMDKNKVLILDLQHQAPKVLPCICQNFEEEFVRCLSEVRERIRDYEHFHFILRPESHHPQESARAFSKFCKHNGMRGDVSGDLDENQIRKNHVYLLVTDDDLVKVVEKSRELNYQPGKDIGIISYNDTPVKKVIADGITVISTDFEEMGRCASDFLLNRKFVRKVIPTRLILRNSL